MQRLRVHTLSVSLDGFASGAGLTDEQPLGHAGERLHEWMFAAWPGATPTLPAWTPSSSRGRGRASAPRSWSPQVHVGTGPIPEDWQGFWGPEPPFHTPVFVLTHHPRPR
jgi:hypothetical protein